MYEFLIYAILSSAMFYLGSRALVTRWLWSRYPEKFAAFMDCPACTGFWYGGLLSLTLGRNERMHLFGLFFDGWGKACLVAVVSLVLTPIVAGIMHWGLSWIGSAQTTRDIEAQNNDYDLALREDYAEAMKSHKESHFSSELADKLAEEIKAGRNE